MNLRAEGESGAPFGQPAQESSAQPAPRRCVRADACTQRAPVWMDKLTPCIALADLCKKPSPDGLYSIVLINSLYTIKINPNYYDVVKKLNSYLLSKIVLIKRLHAGKNKSKFLFITKKKTHTQVLVCDFFDKIIVF
jgi:hypothetical protein